MNRCPSCGGAVPHPRPGACIYCGTALPALAAVPAAAPSPELSLAERFEALARHPNVPAILRSEGPSGAGELVGGGFGVIFGLVFAGAGLFFMTQASSLGAPGFFSLFPLIFVAIGILIATSSLFKAARFAASPTEKLAAIVADERTEVSGGGENRSASTIYYVLLEFRDGRRREYRAPSSVAGAVTRGDLGIAFIRGEVLLGFRRVPV